MDVLIEDSAARLANFRLAQARRLSIERTSLRDADFYETELTESALLDCDLTQANFAKAKAPEIAIFGSVLDGIRGANSLTNARIDADQVIPIGAALVAALGITVTDRTR